MEERRAEMPQENYYFPVVYEKTGKGIGITVVGLETIITSADTIEEAERNAREAISSHIAAMDPEELAVYSTPPLEVSVSVIAIPKGK